MTLKELSEQYKAAAVPLRERLSDLRRQLARADNPEDIWHLKRRIAELTPMLTRMNELAWLLAHYYEIGGADRDSRYGFNGKHKAVKREPDENLTRGLAKRIKRFAAPDVLGVPLRDEEHPPDRKGAGRAQEYRLPDTATCGTESTALHEVLPDVSAFFGPDPKKNRRKR